MIEERRLIKEIEIPEGITASVEDDKITIKGNLGELSRKIKNPLVTAEVSGNKILLKPKKCTKKQKMLINTIKAHLTNMIKGVQEGFTYKLKICSGHFPMNANVEGNKVVVKNYFGEKVPREALILPGVQVEIKGDEIKVSGSDIEAVGQTALNIEKSTSIKNRDRRIFQDGIWITEKAGKKVGEQ